MDLKFYLNKILKVDNIEYYTIKTLNELKTAYDSYLKKTKGIDPDFPNMVYSEYADENLAVTGTNAYSIFGDEENIPDDYKGIRDKRLDNE